MTGSAKNRWQLNKSLPFKEFTEGARIDVEGWKTWTIWRGDVVKLHELDLGSRQRRIGQAFGDEGERVPQGERCRHESAPEAEVLADGSNESLVAIGLRTCELIDRCGFRDLQSAYNALGHILHAAWLQLRSAAAE